MNKYRFTHTWFIGSEIKQKLLNFIDPTQRINVLEIGCFEGLSSVFFADQLLNHPESSLTCVDPFLSIENNDHSSFLMNNEEHNFDYNIKICNNSNKIDVKKITSDAFFNKNENMFDFIYIDGCHETEYIKKDMTNSFAALKHNGIMWMDDYNGGDGIKIKNTMNNFLNHHEGKYKIIHIGYQLAIRKTTYEQ